jgi:hypothetical protein
LTPSPAPPKPPARSTCQVKERTKESTGIHTELARLAADQWRGALALLPGGGAATPPRARLEALLRGWAGAGAGGPSPRLTTDSAADSDGGGEAGTSDGGGKGGEAAAAAATAAVGAGAGRTLEVMGQSLDAPMLARVLAEALAPFDAAGESPGAGAKGGGGGGKGGEGDGDGADAEDIAALAAFVLQRFGAAPAAAGGGDEEVGWKGGRAWLGASEQANATALPPCAHPY